MSRYPFMPLSAVLRYVPEMEKHGVSEVARSPRGFLTAYRAAGTANKLSSEWKKKREDFISRHLVQYKQHPTYRRYLALIAWSYLPPKPPSH